MQSIRLREARDINEGNASRSVTTGITDMRVMFDDTSSFNQDISSWDTSSVTDMSGMFRDASSFDLYIFLCENLYFELFQRFKKMVTIEPSI